MFVLLGRSEPELLATLEKDRAQVGAQLGDRCQKVASRGVRFATNVHPSEAAIAGLLLVAACSKDKNSQAVHQFISSLYHPDLRMAFRGNAAARRLLTPFLSHQLEEPWRLHQTVWLARTLGLDEFIENTLKPEARKQALAAAAKPDFSGNLSQAASIATMLGLRDVIEGTLKPAARQLVERSAERIEDPAQLYQTVCLLQSLKMEESINTTLRLAACACIASVAEKPYDQYRFHMALSLARMLKLEDTVDRVLKPAAVRALISLSQQIPKNPSQMHAALHLARTFELKEASDDFLKPAARRLASEAARSGDLNRLTNASQFVAALGISDKFAEELSGAVRKVAAEPTEDVVRINQLVALANTLSIPDVVDKTLKPQARRTLLAAIDRPIQQDVHQVLQLARTLHLKEGVPLALKAAATKKINAWTRCNAIMFVAEFGGKEHIQKMESLLTDTTNVGSMGLNFTTIHTELRDVALAAMISLSADKLDDYGFPYIKMLGGGAGPLSNLSAQCYGFADAAGRDAALKKWKERSLTRK
jgi:hypothetical protein